MSTQNVNVGRDAQGNAIGDHAQVANTNSFNHCAEPSAAEKELAILRTQLADLQTKLPADRRAEAALLAKKLEDAVTKADPDSRAWYSISAKGLLEASQWVKDFSGNISGTLLNLGKAVWPDFTLPKPNATVP